jgi:hypothetical protein
MTQLTHLMGGDSVLTNTEAVQFTDGSLQTTAAAPLNVNATYIYASGSQNMPTESEGQASSLILSFDTNEDSNASPGFPSMYSSGTPTVLTAPTQGYYIVIAGFSVTAQYTVTGAQIAAQLYKQPILGGSPVCFAQQSSTADSTINQSFCISQIIAMDAGDQVYINVYQSCGGTVPVLGGTSTFLSMALLT